MSAIHHLHEWRQPGCEPSCFPRSHDVACHEAYGYARGLAAGREPVAVVRTGPLVIDLDARTATVGGAEVACSGREWQLLAYLARHLGSWRGAAEIHAAVWGGAVTDPHGVAVLRCRLRARLGGAGGLIEANHGRTRLARSGVQP